jgi:hypothetical protein
MLPRLLAVNSSERAAGGGLEVGKGESPFSWDPAGDLAPGGLLPTCSSRGR